MIRALLSMSPDHAEVWRSCHEAVNTHHVFCATLAQTTSVLGRGQPIDYDTSQK